MLCYRRFSSLRSVVFLALLCTFLLTIIKTNDTYATTIECQDFSSSLNQLDFTTSQTRYFKFSDYCDTSTLDSSKPWFYSLDSFSSNTSLFNVTFHLSRSYPISGSNIQSTLGEISGLFSNDIHFWGVDVPGSSNSYLRYFNLYLYANNRFSSGQSLTFSNFHFTISDVYPYSGCPESPSGSLSITENGTYDVTSYASAVVDVPPIPGDYHDDLVNIRTSIYTCGAILLVLYFFYCIYRMIIRGVKK